MNPHLTVDAKILVWFLDCDRTSTRAEEKINLQA